MIVADMTEAARVLRAVRKVMKELFNIGHVTVQIEDESLRGEEAATRA